MNFPHETGAENDFDVPHKNKTKSVIVRSKMLSNCLFSHNQKTNASMNLRVQFVDWVQKYVFGLKPPL